MSALRAKGMALPNIIEVLAAIASVPHTSLSVTPAVAISALMLYQRHGGSRRLHYFDAFHVATARMHGLPMITSDVYIIMNNIVTAALTSSVRDRKTDKTA